MKKVCFAVAVLLSMAATAFAYDSKSTMAVTPAATGPAQSICPVSGEPIDPTVFVDYEGQRVYFSSQEHIATFMKDPDPYMKRLTAKERPFPEPPPREE